MGFWTLIFANIYIYSLETVVTDTNHLQKNAAAEMEKVFGVRGFLMEMKVFGLFCK